MSDLTITIPGWLVTYAVGMVGLAIVAGVLFAVFLNKQLDAGRDNHKGKKP